MATITIEQVEYAINRSKVTGVSECGSFVDTRYLSELYGLMNYFGVTEVWAGVVV